MTETRRFIGKCRYCGAGAVEDRAVPFGSIERRCGNCRMVVTLRVIVSVVGAKRCDGRCTASTAARCSCKCGGRNHGSAHDWKVA